MKLSAALAVLVGLAVAVGLIVANDAAEIGGAVLAAGWGILVVIALHLPQSLFSSFGWRALVVGQRPGRGAFFALRWIAEGVKALLPVAQIGGDVVRARLLAFRGVGLSRSGASVTVDVTVEMLSQIVFALLGISVLFLDPQGRTAVYWIAGCTIVAIAIGVGFAVAQKLGLFRLFERMLIRLADRLGWTSLNDIAGLHDEIVLLYTQPRRLWASGGYHLASWLLGTVETMAALQVLGIHAGWRDALIIESLGQIVRSAAFVVPGALGVQEGGYILICGLLGISPQSALELSLVRRVREVALGLPGLVAWQRMEARFARCGATPGAEAAAVDDEPRTTAWTGEGR